MRASSPASRVPSLKSSCLATITAKMEYKELISSFAERYGIENVSLENGEVTLVVDYTAVTIREAKNVRAIIVSAMIGGPVPDAKGRLASYMLQANHLFAGANAMTICQKEDTDEYLVVRAIPRALADVETLAKTIEELADAVVEWRGNLTSFMDVDGEAEQKEDEEKLLNPLFGGFYIQV